MDREFCIECIINSRALIPELSEKIIADLRKLERIEQIVASWNNDASHSFEDMCKINGILKE